MGRPKLGDRIEYRIPSHDRIAIKRIAEEKGLSESEVVRRIISWALAQKRRRTAQSEK